MIKTINDIPNNEVGRYLSCAIGALVKAEKIINKRDAVSEQEIFDSLNKIMVEYGIVVENEAPPACARVDLMVAALEDEIKSLIGSSDYHTRYRDGLETAIQIIKEFKGVEV